VRLAIKAHGYTPPADSRFYIITSLARAGGYSGVAPCFLFAFKIPGLKEFLQSLSFFERITNISFKAKNALKVALHSGFPHYESKRLPSSERGQSHTDTHRLYGVPSSQAAAHAYIR
jgi:hypothetical protein